MFRSAAKTLGVLLILTGCVTVVPPESSGSPAAIRAVLDRDTELGGIRNHAPEKMPLAEAVRAYVRSLDAIDFSRCPTDFTAAFKRHRDAWQESIPYLEEHAELRGEIHDLFDEIRESSSVGRTRIERIEKRIWDTWAEVEAAVERHDGESSP